MKYRASTQKPLMLYLVVKDGMLFPPRSETRQGFPLLQILFNILVEILASKEKWKTENHIFERKD